MDRWGRHRSVIAAALAVAALGCPATAAADAPTPGGEASVGQGAVVESLETAPSQALRYWTQARLEGAEPLPTPVLPGGPGGEPGAGTPDGEATPAPGGGDPEAPGTLSTLRTLSAATTAPAADLGATAALAAVDSGESTLFPNRANGVVFGVFRTKSGIQNYTCSGSVVNSPAGDVVLTAGHCVMDAETGAEAKLIVFIPGWREGSDPYGVWVAEDRVMTTSWKETAGHFPNEGGDVALLVLADRRGRSVEDEVGSLGIAFDQACAQTYTQWGYPAASPFDGEVLYAETAPYLGIDLRSFFAPRTMKIASDFTSGASGGPWTIGPVTAPTVVSVTDYGYEDEPGYLYGAYFGTAAREAYEVASGTPVAPGVEEACTDPVPVAPPAPAPTAAPPQPQEPPPAAAPPAPAAPVSMRVLKVRHHSARGSAVVLVKVGAKGVLKLSGAAVRADSVKAPRAGDYRLKVAPKGGARRRLRRRGGAKVGVRIAFRAHGGTRRVTRAIRLTRRRVHRSTHHDRHPTGRRGG